MEPALEPELRRSRFHDAERTGTRDCRGREGSDHQVSVNLGVQPVILAICDKGNEEEFTHDVTFHRPDLHHRLDIPYLDLARLVPDKEIFPIP